MKCIIITGPIGSGKTTVTRIVQEVLRQKGHAQCVLELDELGAKSLDNHDVQEALVKEFGSEVARDGKVRRATLARKAFVDAHSVEMLNAITHPAILREAQRESALFAEENPQGVLILETPFPGTYLRKIASQDFLSESISISVEAPLEVRMDRSRGRFEDADVRAKLQEGYGPYVGDYRIENNSSLTHLKASVDKLMTQILEGSI